MSNVTQWLFGGGLVVVIGLFTAILRVAYKLGGDAKEISSGLTRISNIEQQLSQVPILTVRVGQVEKALQDYRSDIRELLRERRGGSQPDPNER